MNLRRPLLFIVALSGVWLPAGRLYAESLTVETEFPAASAVYGQIVTTGQGGGDTVLSRERDNVIMVSSGNSGGNVGIGVASPRKKLDVGGNIRVSGAVEAGRDIRIGANSVAAQFSCSGGVNCRREGDNTLRIELCQSDGSCSVTAPSACGQTAAGVDNCGDPCTRSSAACVPVNCVGVWSACSKTCGGGTQTYTVTVPARDGGTECPYANGYVQTCNTQACACVPNGSCSAPIPSGCGRTTYGTDNCGNSCTRSTYACPPAQGSCTASCTSPGRGVYSTTANCGSESGSCTAYGPVGTRLTCWGVAPHWEDAGWWDCFYDGCMAQCIAW